MVSTSAVLKEIGKDFLECGICLERYTNPKVLECVHSFCEKCLVKYYGNDQVMPCPMCRQETKLPVPGGVSGVKTNGFLIKLRDKVELWEKVAITSDKAQRVCELCTENEVTHHCLNCSQNICASCKNFHPRIKGMADHTVGTLKDICEGKVTFQEEENEYRCNQHKGEVNRFYCETCHVLICRDCTVVDHSKPEHHQYIDRAAASSKYRQVLKEIFPTFSGEVEALKQQLEATSKAQQYFQKNIAQTVQDFNRRAERLILKVKAEEDRVIGKIRALEETRNTTFDGHIKTMKSLLQRKQHTLTLATDVTTKGSDSDFLSLFSTINQDLSFLRSQVPPPQIDAKLHYIRLGQGPTPEFINLDELDLGDTKWELRREVGEDRTIGSSLYVAALQGDKLAVISTLGHLVFFNSAGGIDKVIQSLGRCCGISASSNHIAVVGVQSSSTVNIKVYNQDFTLACQFSPELPRLGLNENKVNHRCVCLKKDGSILVGHDSRKLVTLHRPDGPLIRTIPVETTPRFLATDSTDRVIVSGHCDNQVTVMDDQGVTLVTIKPTIDGQPVRSCRGICCDGSDIYVAVAIIGTGHIHRYDGYGKFISCVAQGLRSPHGITFTHDGQHLAVADEKRVKIYHRV